MYIVIKLHYAHERLKLRLMPCIVRNKCTQITLFSFLCIIMARNKGISRKKNAKTCIQYGICKWHAHFSWFAGKNERIIERVAHIRLILVRVLTTSLCDIVPLVKKKCRFHFDAYANKHFDGAEDNDDDKHGNCDDKNNNSNKMRYWLHISITVISSCVQVLFMNLMRNTCEPAFHAMFSYCWAFFFTRTHTLTLKIMFFFFIAH